MSQQHRPSVKELARKLKGAKEAIEKGRRFFAEPEKTVGELEKLGIGKVDEVWSLISTLLQEVKPELYEGKRPPEKASEISILGKELFPFCWNSNVTGKRMYLKFVLTDEAFYYVSLHESKF